MRVCVRVCRTYSSIKKIIVVLLFAYFPTSGYSTTCYFFLAVGMFSSSPGLLKVFEASLSSFADHKYRRHIQRSCQKGGSKGLN
jgi:hypothetical protein